MASQQTRTTDEDVQRYRDAAEDALDQLAWCVRYLERIRKRRVADSLARNHAMIRRRLNADRSR
jgi:hypothetical protein